MFRSLRFQLPALFLAGLVLAGIVAAVIAGRLFQSFAHERSLHDLRRDAAGLTALYKQAAGQQTSEFVPRQLEKATGDRIYYAEVARGINPFPGQNPGWRRLPKSFVNFKRLTRSRKPLTFEMTPPHSTRRYLAVASPLAFRGHVFGALVIATPQAAVRSTWLRLVRRLTLAFLVGIAVAGALAAYLSRRITRPVLALSRAADEVAEGRYEAVSVPSGGSDEVSHLAERFGEMATRLHEAEVMERNFLMTVSHELRTPLTAIRGHIEALREGVVRGEDARRASFDVISTETDRLERLVGDVLDLAKLDARRFTVLREEVDMERLVEQAYTAFDAEARRRSIDYRREISARPVIETDGDRVLQVISNLLANAFRWTPDGGQVGLELAAVNGTVRVSVDDSGPGISPQERDRIFRPFWTRDGHGTGLGLAIARELAVALGGSIELDSAPGEGSRFQLVLPAKP